MFDRLTAKAMQKQEEARQERLIVSGERIIDLLQLKKDSAERVKTIYGKKRAAGISLMVAKILEDEGVV